VTDRHTSVSTADFDEAAAGFDEDFRVERARVMRPGAPLGEMKS